MPSPDYLPGAKYGVRAFAGDTNIADLDTASQAMRDDIEAKLTGYIAGTNAARLVATALEGQIWRETDTGAWYVGTGTVWVRIALLDSGGYVPLANLSGITAAQVAVAAGFMRLAPRNVSGNVTANAGDLVIVTVGSALTVTLPAPTAGATLGVAGNTLTTVAGTNIFGLGLANPATSFSLALGIVQLVSDGTNWYIVAGLRDTGWQALSLVNSWAAISGGYTPSYRLTGDRVWLRGGVTGGSATTIATLPSGFRPASTVKLPTTSVFVQITSAGVITGDSTADQALDGHSFSLS